MEQVSSTVVYANAWMSVREDVVRRADGADGVYGVVDKPDFALVLPRGPGGFWMVEQLRYPLGRRFWEFPQGSWSHGAAGSAVDLARAELAEEIGLDARSWRALGHLHGAYGFCSQGFDVFLATDLTLGEPSREPTEQDMVQRFVLDAELVQLVRSGQLVDAPSLAALTLFRWDAEGKPEGERAGPSSGGAASPGRS